MVPKRLRKPTKATHLACDAKAHELGFPSTMFMLAKLQRWGWTLERLEYLLDIHVGEVQRILQDYELFDFKFSHAEIARQARLIAKVDKLTPIV